MDVVSTCSLPVASLVWQPRPGAWVLTVVCRATYVLRPGECTLAPRHEPPMEDDRYGEGQASRSVRVPRDMVPVKPGADVFVVGHVYAPDQRPARAVDARLVVGEIDKRIEAVADRTIRLDGAVREGQTFTRLPLCWERTGGGPGTANPVGVRRDARDPQGGIVLPNLQRPGASLANAFEPVGFGPIAPSWPERRERLGARGASWSLDQLGHAPLPEGMDLGYFNAAPRDQQVRAFAPRLEILLENLHPEHARLATTLSTAAPRAMIEGRPEGPAPLALRADTLWIDTDSSICTLTFRGSVPLPSADAPGRVVVSLDDIAAPKPEARPAVARPPQKLEGTADIPLEIRMGAMNKATLPFAAPAAPRSPAPAPPPAPVPYALTPPVEPAVFGAPAMVGASPWAASARPMPLAPPVQQEMAPLAAGPAPAETSIKPTSSTTPVEPTELIWFDPESVPRLRRKAEWRPILDELEKAPLDPELDDPAFAKDPMLIEDRREVFEILMRAAPLRAESLEGALARCARDDGKFVPALVLVTGELELPFDELGALRATITTVSPLLGPDEALRASVQAGKDFLATPGLMSAPAVAEGLTKRIEDAFAQGKRVVPVGYLEAQRERALVEQRQYQRRAVFGAKHVRALLRLDGSDAAGKAAKAPPAANAPVPTYLPDAIADALPMYSRFRARIIAELRLAADRYESHAASLRVMAIARVATSFKSS